MDYVLSFTPSTERGLLPRYLFVIAIVSFGNAVQNLTTLHYTRRLYSGLFVPNPKLVTAASSPSPPSPSPLQTDDRVDKLIPAQAGYRPDGFKDKPATPPQDQVTPLSARLFGAYTIMAGLIRLYASWRIEDTSLYQLALLTHVVAAGHFTSEILVFKTCRFSWEILFPLVAGWAGMAWMGLQYSYYVQ